MTPRTTDPVADLRAQLAGIDLEIVALVARRLELATELGAEKTALGMPAADPAREAAVLRNVSAAARAAGVDVESVRQIFWCLIELCRSVQLPPAASADALHSSTVS